MKKTKLVIFLVLVSLAVSGCSVSVKTKDTSGSDGGLFMSTNKGQTWGQVNSVPTATGVESINSLDVSSLTLDPNDTNAVYFGSVGKGLYYAYNLGYGWQKTPALSEGTVGAVAIAPDNKCFIYVSIGNKLFFSKDCNRTYEQIYYDNDVQVEITAIAIDHYDSKKIYMGTSKGDILKSSDSGSTWQTVLRAGFRVFKIALSSQDSRIIFVSTNGNSIYRSVNGGLDWDPLKDKMKEFPNTNKIMDFSLSPSEGGLIFAATQTGIYKSIDNGDVWVKIELITSEKDVVISALAVNPKNSKEIYYATRTTFYSSFDGGVSWSAKKLPSSRAGWKIVIKSDQPNIILMGMKKFKQQ